MSKEKEPPVFITSREISRHVGVKGAAPLTRWVAEGTFPPPHSRPGERTTLWLRKHWDQYVKTGRWPQEAWR